MAGGSFCWIQWTISELEALTQDATLKKTKNKKQKTPHPKPKHTNKQNPEKTDEDP